MYQTRVHQAIDLIDGKNISRAKIVLKVDLEYLRRTLPLKDITPTDSQNG